MKRRSQFFIDPITKEIKISFLVFTNPYWQDEMKRLGFIWNPIEKTWCAKKNEERLAFAKRVEFFKEDDTPKEPKAPKVPSPQISFDLYQQGRTVVEIAQERGLTENTILKHLMMYAEKGEIDVHEFVSDDVISKIAAYKRTHPEIAGLKEIFEYYNETISYGEIKLALAYIDSL